MAVVRSPAELERISTISVLEVRNEALIIRYGACRIGASSRTDSNFQTKNVKLYIAAILSFSGCGSKAVDCRIPKFDGGQALFC
jgi:hypothetical protein